MKRSYAVLLVAAAFLTETQSGALAQSTGARSAAAPVEVTIDFAKVVTFTEVARTVIIGNPNIVDGVLNDEHTIVLTGKANGVTNLIILGDGGREVLNTVINVAAGAPGMTTVYAGASPKTYTCAGTCKPVLSVGDEATHFDRARDQIKVRQEFNGTAAR